MDLASPPRNHRPSTEPTESRRLWRTLTVINRYRLVISGLFVIAIFSLDNPGAIGNHNPLLFRVASSLYLLIALVAGLAIRRRWPHFSFWSNVLIMVDIFLITVLMHASGSIRSGFGMLLVVAIAGNSLIMGGRPANLFAAIAALALLAEQVRTHLAQSVETNYTHAGFLGATLFATAILSHVLSKRVRESQALAAQRGIDLANMAQLNEHVIRRMQSGIIVVDADERIRLMNESAWDRLGLPMAQKHHNQKLTTISPKLANQLRNWRQHGSEPAAFKPTPAGTDIIPAFARLGADDRSGTLIFLEDSVRMAQQAQQMKLASLGRLTASIAHEIRNPLGAISHAEQLLNESTQLDQGDQRLAAIIHTNTARVNDIVENVLQLSRRDRSAPETISIKTWLQHFIAEFGRFQGLTADEIKLSVEPNDISVHCDSTQLHQILWNLCQNGYRYAANHPHNPKLELNARMVPGVSRPFLDVIDHGPGIAPEIVSNIFEPFYTTESTGSGLGLYIARELCETNKAALGYIPQSSGGSCFRIEFAKGP